MTDAVAVFPPGFRVTDSSTGAPLSGAVIRFYDAGTTNPKIVYSDAELTTSLGTSVTTDALGYPTSDGITKTLIYVGTSAYKLTIETSASVLIASHDNLKGAVQTVDATDASVTATRPVETKSLNYTVLQADQSKVFSTNCSGGDVTYTLPSAVTVGSGWLFTIQHSGGANQTIMSSVSSQQLASGATNYGTVFALSNSGEEVTLVSDGSNWRIINHVGPHIKRGQGVLTIADRLSAAPGSPPEAGTLYIATGAATWGSTSVSTHDVVLHTSGGAYVRFTPVADCGWVAFVQDEDLYYHYIGSAWVSEAATTSVPGTVELATDAETTTATDTARVAPVSSMRRHPGMAKAWGLVTYSGGTPTLASGSHNITSITDTATGRLTVTIADDFSSANYVIVATTEAGTTETRWLAVSTGTRAAGSFELNVQTAGGSLSDPASISFACFGTLA